MTKATIGVAGLGGLGSNVAAALVRLGTGKMIIADFDRIEPSNLNRQQYYPDQIGTDKSVASLENLKRINPQANIESHKIKLTAENIPQIFKGVHIIAECFDSPDQKQMLVETVLTKMPDTMIVTASGLAGYGKSNQIITQRLSDRLIFIGDGQTGTETEPRLTASRVGIAAYHQANAIAELIIDEIFKDNNRSTE